MSQQIPKPQPPPDLAALWRIEGHLRNINHCVIFLTALACLWIVAQIGGGLLKMGYRGADSSNRPSAARHASSP